MAHILLINTPDFRLEKKVSKWPMQNMHCHNSAELYYILKGEREYFVGDQFFKMSEGDLILVPEGILHRTDGKSATCLLVNFSMDYLAKYFTPKTMECLHLNRPFVFRPAQAQKESLSNLCNALHREYSRLDCEDTAILAGYLYQILFAISYDKNDYVQESYKDRRISSVVKYINENYNAISNIEELSERFYISKYHLCRLFAQNLGVSLIGYLNTIKIKAACKLLSESKKGITDVAMECGFNSSSYFCKVFKSEMGMSPTAYKNSMRDL